MLIFFSALFGNEDQDYRHADTISPRGGGQVGWARYKADHPQDFDSRRSSIEDIDQRQDPLDQRHQAPKVPRDTDFRTPPFSRPPGRSPGYNEPVQRIGQPPSEEDVPQELRIENREQILRKMEMRRKSGELSHQELQTVLRSLSEFDSLQEQKRHHHPGHEPPLLEPEVHRRDERVLPPRLNEPLMDYNSPGKAPIPRQNEPLMEYSSPRKDRSHQHDADIRRDQFRGLDRPKDDRGPREEPVRPSLLGPGPGPRLNKEPDVTGSDRDRPIPGPDPAMNFDVDLRKPTQMDRGPLIDRRPDVEVGRSPVDRPKEVKPSLLGPGPVILKEKEPPIVPKLDPVKRDVEKKEKVFKPKEKKKEGAGLAVGAMLEMLRSENSPDNSQDAPMPKPVVPDALKAPAKENREQKTHRGSQKEERRSKSHREHGRNESHRDERRRDRPRDDRRRDRDAARDENRKDVSRDENRKDTPRDENRREPPRDERVPRLVPKPIYDPDRDDRWMMPGGVRIKDGVLNIFPDGTEEIVVNGQPHHYRMGGPKRIIPFKGDQLEAFIEQTRRTLLINGTAVYKVADPVKEVFWGPGPNQRAQVFYHGNPRNMWIDGFLYNLRIDAPPKIIRFRDKEHTVLIDGRDGMLLIDKKEYGTYGGKPRFVRLDDERVEMRFTPPPKNIVIDGLQCQIRLDRKIPFIVMDGVARGIRFDGPPRDVIINGQKFLIPTDRAVEVCIDGIFHMVAFGGPSHEIIIDGNWYELQFNGPPREITVGNQRLLVGLPCPPPDVKILDPIENQSLKEPDVEKSGGKRDKRHGSDDRNSPSFGQKKPVSILDLDIAKPPGLKNKDRLKGSPLYDERSRSPDSHKDRRRRSPHRRHSPDRRGGSPQINDQFNGPSMNQTGPPQPRPPFIPGQPFNQGGPNQPFQHGPNQPFPPNQQFPGPNQPPFSSGPNQRFPLGPNQPPFMPGPNQPFPSGPNQIFPPGQNQQMPGPGAMPPFQMGPRPMMQDEGSQGPHPMFQQGPQGQPLQSMPGMPPNMSQSMPMPGQPMPIQGPPVSVAGQLLPGQPMMPPGSVPISVMNQPINPG